MNLNSTNFCVEDSTSIEGFLEDMEDVFLRNIDSYAYFETPNFNAFIIIRSVDKRNNILNHDTLMGGTWRLNFAIDFRFILRYEIFDTKERGLL